MKTVHFSITPNWEMLSSPEKISILATVKMVHCPKISKISRILAFSAFLSNLFTVWSAYPGSEISRILGSWDFDKFLIRHLRSILEFYFSQISKNMKTIHVSCKFGVFWSRFAKIMLFLTLSAPFVPYTAQTLHSCNFVMRRS